MVAVRQFHAVLIALTLIASASADDGNMGDAEAVFNQRILPIFGSEKPSSCVQCHLASVDLKNYILPSSQKTFLSLRDQGLVDLQQPAK